MSRYHFVNGNYQDALKMINLLFESKFLKHTVFLEAHCRMLNLLIHYKIGNHKLLGHLIAATVKFLKSRNKFYKTEAAVINCLKKIIKAVDNGIVKNNFQLLSKELTSLKKNVYESNINIYFNYLKWSENEIEIL